MKPRTKNKLKVFHITNKLKRFWHFKARTGVRTSTGISMGTGIFHRWGRYPRTCLSPFSYPI